MNILKFRDEKRIYTNFRDKKQCFNKKKTPKITTATDEPKVQHVNNKSIQITLKKY